MLNIDLEFLNFLVNPTTSYIKDDIATIQQEYLKQNIDLKTITKKLCNFYNSKPILLTTIDDLRFFLYQMNSALTEEVYYKFAKYLNLKLKNNVEGNNFIETILLDNDIDNIHEDENLIILRSKIRKYLIEITKTTTNKKDKLIASNSIKYLDSLLKKYDSIKKILEPKETLVKEITNIRKEKSQTILKQIIKEHSYLLSEEKKQLLENNPNINLNKILHKEKLFKMFFSTINNGEINNFHMGPINCFKSNTEFSVARRKTILKELGIELEKENIDINDVDTIFNKLNYKYISNGKIYKGKEILEQLESDINKYNELYKNEIEDYILTIKKEELYNIIKKQVTNTLKDTNNQNLENYINSITNGILNHIKKNNNTISGFTYTIKSNQDHIPEGLKNIVEEIPFQTYILLPLRSIEIVNNKLLNSFYFTLSHELGHIYTPQNKTSEDYRLLNEIYNDYRSDKIVFNLLCNNHFQKKGIKFKKTTNLYSLYTFFLIDLFEEYSEIFEEFANKDNIIYLIQQIGYETFRDIMSDIITFDIKKRKKEEEQEKYLNKANSYLKRIKQRHNKSNNNFNPYGY